jgi:uncharacterized protein (DUF2384 family)
MDMPVRKPRTALPEPVPPEGAGIADLASPAERAALTPAAVEAMARIAGNWGLSVTEIAGLLGGISERTWFRFLKSPPDELSQDQLTRISAVVGLFKGLRLLFSEPLASQWVKRPNAHPAFGGRPPLAAMIAGGIPKMLQTRAYVDALRGGL